MASENLVNWTDQQKKYIEFLGRGKKNKKGERRSKEQFAKAIGVHFTTLYDWQAKPGFLRAVLDATIAANSPNLSAMVQAHEAKAQGQPIYYVTKENGKEVRKKLNPDTGSFREILKLYGLVVSKSEVENTGEITHKWSEANDDELDRAIKARQDRLAGNA